MENFVINKKQNFQEQKHELFNQWFVWFLLSSWIVFALLFYLRVPQKILLKKIETEEKKTVSVLLKNKEQENLQKDPTATMLSDQDNQAQGSLTSKKDFQNLSPYNDLSFSRKGETSSSLQESSQKEIPLHKKNKEQDQTNSASKKNSFVVQFVKLIQKQQKKIMGRSGMFDWAKSDYTRIPDNYPYQKEFALSFDRLGNPIIPTKKYEHYDYFRKLVEKIRQHWYPPGGSYHPPIGDDFFATSNFTPGYTRVQAFPSQEVQTIFMLNAKGDVIDVRIYSSLGYKSLDQSCLDAIRQAKNFGAPPQELLERGTLIVPFFFRIVFDN